MKRGTQIVYIPRHANGNEAHPDCEDGFVTSTNHNTVFCRFWSKHYNSDGSLRTRWNSEGCAREDLITKNTRPQTEVDRWLGTLEEEGQLP